MKKLMAAATALSLAAGTSSAQETEANFNNSMHCVDKKNGMFLIYHEAYGETPVATVRGAVDVFNNTTSFVFDGKKGSRSNRHDGGTLIKKGPFLLSVHEDFMHAIEINEGGSAVFEADYKGRRCSIRKENGNDKRYVTMKMQGPGE